MRGPGTVTKRHGVVFAVFVMVGLFFLLCYRSGFVWAQDQWDATSVSVIGDYYQFDQNITEIRFIDNNDGTVTDTKTNLMWLMNGRGLYFFSAVTWDEAVKKCGEFNYRGYTNWRIPTIEEWKSILDPRNKRPSLVEPNPFKNIVVHMPYWSATDFIYGREYTCINVCPIHAYTVTLWQGSIGSLNKNKRAFVLPVRTLD